MSDSLQKAVEIIPKFTGFLSLSGSGWIIFEVLSDSKKRTHIYHRIMLTMSIFDHLQAWAWFLSSWPEDPERSTISFYAAGNDKTCNFQGFLWQISNGTSPCNSFLSLYYVLLIRYNWSAQKIARRCERWFLGFVLVYTVGTSVAGFPLKLYNPLGLGCWIAPYPLDCKQSFENGGETDCIRGDNAKIYTWAFLLCEVWVCIIFSTVAMLMMYLSVLNIEKKNQRYIFGSQGSQGRDKRKTERSKQVAKSCLFYLVAFYFVWFPHVVWEALRLVNSVVSPGVYLFMVTTFPLQGFMNFLVYLRPRYLDYRRKNPDASVFLLLGRSLRKAIQKYRKADDDDDFEVMAEVPESFNKEFDTDASKETAWNDNPSPNVTEGFGNEAHGSDELKVVAEVSESFRNEVEGNANEQ
mmetsp:Transcript_38627/g.71394  ORF Transcript_38627/g.71394 Transcript_38627/m.71394 type:complete len:409 (-) Transcript_38627:265-1491(-)|eukprot:CAMPEP_0197438980 /NCGR_PEP_ID=MMETSP1175-20131217/5826_1 /TAXON_ID=1003142 /ORGANISM="Triceratium dubium, Strain CCMP147" /LENGTH=408 /DNA_ID=CAMNT_0042968801 /DNA_START=203 /DNA_END=1429 /DNA_ORIENTATION=-